MTITEPDAVADAGAAPAIRTLQEDADTRVSVVAAGGELIVHKSHRPRARLRTLLRRSRGEREFRNLRKLASARVPVVWPIGWRAERRLGMVVRSELATAWFGDGLGIDRALAAFPRGAIARRLLAVRYGALVRDLHRAGFVSTTLQPRNVLVGSAGAELRLCDQPWLVALRRPAFGTSAADVDLYDVAFSAARRREMSAVERFRLVLAYSAGDRSAARATWRRLAARGRRMHRVRKQFARVGQSFGGAAAWLGLVVCPACAAVEDS